MNARDDAFLEYEQAGRVIVLGLLFGLVALGVFGSQAPTPVAFVALVGAGLALMGAGAAIGAVIGFLFGIPRSLQEPGASSAAKQNDDASPGVPYAGNTSLEQISDWLTKIIVGVGLTQLLNVPTALASLGSVVGPALGGFPGSPIFGTLEFLYFVIGGFFAAYLWTRLRLTSLLVESDEDAKRTAKKATELRAYIAAKELLETRTPSGFPSPGDAGPPGTLSKTPKPREVRLLWVDDRPSNNAQEIEQLKAQGIQVTTMTDSDEALAELKANHDKYDAVITDLKRDFDRQAGYKFMEAARSATGDSRLPFIVYTASSNPAVDTDAKKRGAIGGTNSPIRLFELVNKALHRPDQPNEDPVEPGS
jgi:CheY-like chemotaxis protein